MTVKTVRKVVKIDEELCNGCGLCILSCAEGALKIIDGKARLISDKYCDGLGNCLVCPQGAISIEERAAEPFDEAAARENLAPELKDCASASGCPGTQVKQFGSPAAFAGPGAPAPSRLSHWPVQLTLVPPTAPFLKGADLVLAADCVPFADANFHREFLGDNKALLVACPKLDDFSAHQEKLNQILQHSGIRSITVVHMEVPCCSGLVLMAKQAMLAAGNNIPFNDVTIGIRGERKSGDNALKTA